MHILKNDNDILLMKQSKEKYYQNFSLELFLLFSWIMNYFYSADKDGSNTLTKKECRQFLTDALNAKISKEDFEKLFKVKKN